MNSAATALFGYSEAELLELTFQDITHPDDLNIDLEGVRKLLEGSIETYQIEKRYQHKQGHIIWVLLSVSLVRDRSGEPLHFISQIQDIGKRKHSEIQLKERDALLSKLSQQVPGSIYQYHLRPDGTSYFPFASEGIWDIYEVRPQDVKEDASLVFERLHPKDYDGIISSIEKS
ncbi:MAG: PAS domain S-box protein, partial [Owenweeksia sp.]